MTPEASQFSSYLQKLSAQLIAVGQRQLIVLADNASWCEQLLDHHLAATAPNALVFGKAYKNAQVKTIDNFRQVLGAEYEFIIFADEDFHPDAFAALSGTLVAGGIMVWFCPNFYQLTDRDPYFQRLVACCLHRHQVTVVNQDNVGSLTLACRQAPTKDYYSDRLGCAHHQQAQAVEQIMRVMTGHRRRPLVLTADRGRGKSSALAIAVSQLLEVADKEIIITAPHRMALNVFFSQLSISCPEGEYSNDSFRVNTSRVRFIPVDILLAEQPSAHLLLIDEAAAIPIYLLEKLTLQYSRVVFATTQHGYEGSGRGFSVKFINKLALIAPEYHRFHIDKAIRWSDGDPLEEFVFNTFLLNASLPEPLLNAPQEEVLSYIETEILTSSQLATNESLLRYIVAILVTAHYQTSPSDVKLLLSNKQVKLFVSVDKRNNLPVAVALCLSEGQVSEQELALLTADKVRLKSQFIPQSLLTHCGEKNAFNYRYLRIVRIAVLEPLQQLGIGKQLLSKILAFGKQANIDIIGTSFGANAQLLTFWGQAEYKPIRIGFMRDHASGEHSCLMLHGISALGQKYVADLTGEFYRYFPYYLAEQFAGLPPSLVRALLSFCSDAAFGVVADKEKYLVAQFACGRSQYDVSASALNVWLLNLLTTKHARALALDLLVAKVLQRKNSQQLCHEFELTGKRCLQYALRQQVIEALATQLTAIKQ